MRGSLRAGIDPNVVTDKGVTALHYAADCGDASTIRVLIGRGADATKVSDEVVSPMVIAALGQKADAVKAIASSMHIPVSREMSSDPDVINLSETLQAIENKDDISFSDDEESDDEDFDGEGEGKVTKLEESDSDGESVLDAAKKHKGKKTSLSHPLQACPK